eukprot:COSAG04_NODE_12797_length_634_cov_2.592523_2_plen_129_part_01
MNDHAFCRSCRGVGHFTVEERGSLALTGMLIQSSISVAAGGSLTAHRSNFRGTLAMVAITGTMDAQGSTFSTALTVSGTASLTGCTLAASATVTASAGGSLSLAAMAMPATVLAAAEGALSGEGSTLLS